MSYLNKIKLYSQKFTASAPQYTRYIFSSIFVFIFIYLAIDSVYVAENYFDGRAITNSIVIIYFLLMLKVADFELRKLMILMVPLSYLGEIFYCHIVDMYDYRGSDIPLYIPFTHGIVYGLGHMTFHAKWAQKYEQQMKKVLTVFFISAFTIAWLVFGDFLSAIFGVFYIYLLGKLKWKTIYYYVGCYALYLEFIGTSFGNWGWHPYSFAVIPTVNPPVGIVLVYITGDCLLILLKRYLERKQIIQKS